MSVEVRYDECEYTHIRTHILPMHSHALLTSYLQTHTHSHTLHTCSHIHVQVRIRTTHRYADAETPRRYM